MKTLYELLKIIYIKNVCYFLDMTVVVGVIYVIGWVIKIDYKIIQCS